MQIITTIILIQCVIFRIVLDSQDIPSAWVDKINQTFTINRMGEILIKTSTEKLPEDVSGLMENLKKPSDHSYSLFCRIINVISFLAALIIFITMFIALFPKGYLSVDYDPIESLS
jgi:hypothetical protein